MVSTTMPTSALLLLILGLLLPPLSATQNACNICTLGPDEIPLPDKLLPPDLPLPLVDCFDVGSAAFLFEDGSDLCQTAQSLGTYCGCNRAPDACNLCWDGSPAPLKDYVTTYEASDFLGAIGVAYNLNCEILEAFLHSIMNSSDQCLQVQAMVGEECGCPPRPVDNGPGGIFNISNITFQPDLDIIDEVNSGDLETPSETQMCSLCPGGDPVPFPDKPVVIQRDLNLTCSEWDSIASATEEGSEDCRLVRSVSVLCGCPRPEGGCNMCPLGEPVPEPTRELNWLGETFLSTAMSQWFARMDTDFLTCGVMESVLASEPAVLAAVFATADGLVCTAAQMKSWICGCKPDWRPIFLTWAYRLSAFLSFMGSIAIIVAIMRKRRDQRFTAYNQLVLGISTFDIVSSLAYILVGVMAPYEAGFYLSRGNEHTCKLQGIMIQLGQTTSMLYNLFLSLYFFFIIVYGWRERQFVKRILWVHLGVVGVGLAMAGGSIPFIVPQFGVCGILPPLTSTQWQVSLFYTMPVSIVLLVLTSATFGICWKVYSQSKKASKWLAGRGLSITRKVFWQSFWYMMAFYVTLPFVLLSFYLPYDSSADFWIFATTAVLAPLQGLMNAFVYFQRNKGLFEIFSWVLGGCLKSLGCLNLCMFLRTCREQHTVNTNPEKAESQRPHSLASSNLRKVHSDVPRSNIESMGDVERSSRDVAPIHDHRISCHWSMNLQTSSVSTREAEKLLAFPCTSSESIEQSSAPSREGYGEVCRTGQQGSCSSPERGSSRSSDASLEPIIVSRLVAGNEERFFREGIDTVPTDEGGHCFDEEDDNDDSVLAAVLEFWRLNEATSSSSESNSSRRRRRTSITSSLRDDEQFIDEDDDDESSSDSSRQLIRSLRDLCVRTESRGLVARDVASVASWPASHRDPCATRPSHECMISETRNSSFSHTNQED